MNFHFRKNNHPAPAMATHVHTMALREMCSLYIIREIGINKTGDIAINVDAIPIGAYNMATSDKITPITGPRMAPPTMRGNMPACFNFKKEITSSKVTGLPGFD